MERQPKSPLHKALESFGCRAQCLSVARLEYYPEVLIELFGEDAVADPGSRHEAAVRVEAALVTIIAEIKNPADRRVAEAIFAAKPEFHELDVTHRIDYVDLNDKGFSRELFKTQRRRIIGDVASALERASHTQASPVIGPVLSPQAFTATRQLYRYAQATLHCIETFDLCVSLVELHRENAEYCEAARSILTSGDFTSDSGLWALAHCSRYLAAVRRDAISRDFLRENLPVSWWRTPLTLLFYNDQRQALDSALTQAELDEPGPFVDKLLEDPCGQVMLRRWLTLLSAREDDEWLLDDGAGRGLPRSRDRDELRKHLVALCVLLEQVCPEDKWPVEEADRSCQAHAHIFLNQIEMAGGVVHEKDGSGFIPKELRDAVSARSPRHLFGEPEELGLDW